ncbi:MAG: hypothetical protein ACAI35_24845 [Candidatus Methylacidiphilales bacterium]
MLLNLLFTASSPAGMIRRSVVLLLAGAVSLPLQALAAPELVKLPAGPASWTIEVSQPKPEKAAGANAAEQSPAGPSNVVPVRVVVTQDKDKRRSVVSYSNGKTQENWDVGNLKLQLIETPSGRVMAMPNSVLHPVPFVTSAFDWVKPDFLIEKEPLDYKGKLCFHYRGVVPVMGIDGPGKLTETKEAWIDSVTLLPVALLESNGLGSFTFAPAPPSDALIMPEKYQQKLEYYRVSMGMHPMRTPAAQRTPAVKAPAIR